MTNFSIYNRPYLRCNEPRKKFQRNHQISRIQISCDDDIPDKTVEGSRQCIYTEIDYYGMDDIYIIEYIVEEMDNPNYDKELANYKKEVKRFQAELAEWEAAKVEYDAKEAKKREAAERKQYRILRAKYGKKDK